MNWLLLEALGAGALLVAIVWWTMFAGRRGGERAMDQVQDEAVRPPSTPADSATPPEGRDR